MEVQVKLYRPMDRDPDDHFYGEPFDSLLNNCVGGKDAWSSPREDRSKTPKAKLQAADVSVELHEDGPLFQFLAEQIPQIPNYVSALAAVVSAWAAMRPNKDDPWWKRELQIIIDKHFYHRQGTPDPNQLEEITKFIAELAQKDREKNSEEGDGA